MENEQRTAVEREVALVVAGFNHTERMERLRLEAELEKQYHAERELLRWIKDVCGQYIDSHRTESHWNLGFYKRKKTKGSRESIEMCVEFAVKHLTKALSVDGGQPGHLIAGGKDEL